MERNSFEQSDPRRTATANTVIAYCGGGISASSDAFILTLLGVPQVAVYDGSLSEWTTDPTLPLETGAVQRAVKEDTVSRFVFLGVNTRHLLTARAHLRLAHQVVVE